MDREAIETDILLTQYKECLSFIRNFDMLAWQVFSITIAIDALVAIPYLGYARTPITRITLLLVSLLFTSVAIIALTKHRFFQQVKVDEFQRVEAALCRRFQEIENSLEDKAPIDFVQIMFETNEIMKKAKENKEIYKSVKRTPISGISAYKSLVTALFISWSAYFILIFVEVFQALTTTPPL